MRQVQVAFVFLLRAIYTTVVERVREKESQGTFFSICSTVPIESLVCLPALHCDTHLVPVQAIVTSVYAYDPSLGMLRLSLDFACGRTNIKATLIIIPFPPCHYIVYAHHRRGRYFAIALSSWPEVSA